MQTCCSHGEPSTIYQGPVPFYTLLNLLSYAGRTKYGKFIKPF